jgi:hypothetical protein
MFWYGFCFGFNDADPAYFADGAGMSASGMFYSINLKKVTFA